MQGEQRNGRAARAHADSSRLRVESPMPANASIGVDCGRRPLADGRRGNISPQLYLKGHPLPSYNALVSSLFP